MLKLSDLICLATLTFCSGVPSLAQSDATVSPAIDSAPAAMRCSENATPGDSGSESGDASANPSKLFFYTGGLDGFIGTKDLCRGLSSGQCKVVIDNKAGELCEIKKRNRAVLIGMGDDFGPTLLWNTSDPQNQYGPVSLIGQRMNPNPLRDQPFAQKYATNFVIELMHRAYDAIVPGKEDLAFGAGYLGAAAKDGVPLVADNLMMQVVPSPECLSFPAPTPSLPLLPDQTLTPISSPGSGGSAESGGGAAAAGGGGGATCPTALSGPKNYSKPALFWPDANAIYPWTMTIAMTVPAGQFEEGSVQICASDSSKDARNDLSGPCVNWEKAQPFRGTNTFLVRDRIKDQANRSAPYTTQVKTEIVRYTLEDPAQAGVDADGDIKAIPPGKSAVLYSGNTVKICMTKANHKDHVCTDGITVQRPVLSSAWITSRAGSSVGDYAIFGALAADTLNGVADANRQWAPSGQDPPIQVTVTDPAQATAQALNSYNLLHPGKVSRAVLLAQMTPAEAKMLADSLGTTSYQTGEEPPEHTELSVILSGADVVEATPALTMTVPGPSEAPTSEGRFIPVMTPSPVFQRFDCLRLEGAEIGNCLAALSFEPKDNDVSLRNQPSALLPRGISPAAPSADNTLCDTQAQPKPGLSRSAQANAQGPATWECSVLDAMRNSMHEGAPRWNPDIAILEEKDFDYLRSGLEADFTGVVNPLQANKALWNAGNLTRVTLLGSTLLSILTQSQTNQGRNYQTLQSVRSSEQLRVRGIYQGQDGQLYVRGSILDPSKLYAVATSDNLASTSSDYPQFANEDLEFPQIFWDNGKTRMISEVVNPTGNPMLLAKTALEVGFPGQPTLNDRKQAAPPVQPVAITHSNRTLFTSAAPPLSAGGRPVQLEPITRFTVQQLAAGYSLVAPSLNNQELGSDLGGITNPNVLVPHSDTISLTLDSRFERYLDKTSCTFCFVDWGLDTQISLSRTRQGSILPSSQLTVSNTPVPTTAVTFPGDSFAAGPFFESQWNKYIHWKPIVLRPALLSFTILPQEQFLAGSTTPAPPPNQGTYFPFTMRRQVTLGENAGMRFEWSDFNFFEAGYSWQKDFHILSAIAIPGGMPCQITSTQSVTTCVQNFMPANVPLIPTYSTYTQQGGYLMTMFTHTLFPWKGSFDQYMPNRLSRVLPLYQASAYGNFFGNGKSASSSALTRYAFALNNSLQFTLPANLTFGPNLSVFWFQANSSLPNSSLVRYSVSAQLNYSFDWRTGLPLASTALGKVQ